MLPSQTPSAPLRAALTVEGLAAGGIIVDDGRRYPDHTQHQQRQQQQHHEGLVHPGHDALQRVECLMGVWGGGGGWRRAGVGTGAGWYLLRSGKTLCLSEEVGKGHEEDKGEVGEEEDQVPEAWVEETGGLVQGWTHGPYLGHFQDHPHPCCAVPCPPLPSLLLAPLAQPWS